MKHCLTLLCCAFLFTVAFAAPAAKNSVKWGNDLAAAQKSVKGTKKSVLLFFTAPGWCGPCQLLEKTVIVSPEFVKIANANAAVRFDLSDPKKTPEEGKAAFRKYHENLPGYLPVLLVLDAEGKEKGRIVGPRPHKEYLATLKKFLKK